MQTAEKVVVVLPAYNAGRTLRLTYEELPKDTVSLVIHEDHEADRVLRQLLICQTERAPRVVRRHHDDDLLSRLHGATLLHRRCQFIGRRNLAHLGRPSEISTADELASTVQ